MKQKKKISDIWQQIWDPITIYKNLRSLYFAIIPKNSRAYERTPEFLRSFLKQMYLLNIYYQEWIRRYDTFTDEDFELVEEKIFNMSDKPSISILMPVFNPPIKFLEEAIESVLNQKYPFWQLCIADDASTDLDVKILIEYYRDKDDRIEAIFREKNGHISAASNSALSLAKYNYIALLDHDDLLHPLALYYVAKTIIAHPDTEIIYSDEDKITKWGRRFDPYFKPEFNYELLLSQNMVSHLGVYKTRSVRQINGFREGLEGSQDYDLLLRILETIKLNQIQHIPRPLYHWRVSNRSVAENVNIKPYATKAGGKALREHLQRKSTPGKVVFLPDLAAYRVDFQLNEPNPRVSIVIPTPQLTTEYSNCLEEILLNTTYSNFNIQLVLPENQTPMVKNYADQWEGKVDLMTEYDQMMLSKMRSINEILENSSSDFLLILFEPLTGFFRGWLNILMTQASKSEIGLVAPKIVYRNGFVYSNGVILLPEIKAQHLSQGTEIEDIGYFGWSKLRRSYSVVSVKCILVNKKKLEMVGGFSENFNEINNAGIDLCLKLRSQGFHNILCPSVELSLHEDYKKNNNFDMPDKDDIQLMEKRWLSWFENDPAFNPNLSIGDDGKILINLNPKYRI